MHTERAHPRYAHEAAISVFVDGKVLQGRSTNVSRGGLCADLEAGVKLGTDVEVDIQLVFDEETHSEPLRVPARVVWCTHLNEVYQVGIAFRPMTADLADYLTMFLRYLDDGSAPTRSRRESNLDKRFG